MKKVLFAAVAVLALASCKKDYSCECEYNGAKYTYQLKDVKKKDASSACDAAGNQWVLLGGKCDLK